MNKLTLFKCDGGRNIPSAIKSQLVVLLNIFGSQLWVFISFEGIVDSTISPTHPPSHYVLSLHCDSCRVAEFYPQS